MTTIATDGIRMVADGRITAGGLVVTDADDKLTRLAGGGIAGFCGDTSDGDGFVRWLNEGGDPDKPTHVGDDFVGLVLLRGGVVMHYDSDLSAVQAALPVAIGSGGRIALGAMLAGATPRRAVEIAAARDVHTGGAIVELAL